MVMTMQKICILLDSSGMGGIETHVQQLANGLAMAGQQVTVVLYQRIDNHPLVRSLQRSHPEIAICQLDGTIGALWTFLRHESPSILHTHGYKAGILGRLLAIPLAISVVSTYHAGEIPSGRVRAYDLLDRYLGFAAAARFAVSHEIRQRLPYPAQVLDNFVDTHDLQQSQGQQLAFVGRLSHEKGPDRLLRLAQQFPKQAFNIYGDGPLATTLTLQATDNVAFNGQCDMNHYWPHIGLVVMPSRYEGLPMAALEAMARGIPVIASDVGDLARVIEHGINGWLVQQDDAKGFEGALQQWLQLSQAERGHMQQQCITTIRSRFSTQAVIPTLLRTYWQIAKPQSA